MDRDCYLDNQVLRMMSLEEVNESLAHLTYDTKASLEKVHIYFDEVYANYGQQVKVDYIKGEIINYHLTVDEDFSAYEEWNILG